MPEQQLQAYRADSRKPGKGHGSLSEVRDNLYRDVHLQGEKMSDGHRKRQKAIEQCIAEVGFTLLRIRTGRRSGHYKCRVMDDAGNCFTACTGTSCSSNQKKAHLNFKQDLRRLSNRAKGLIG